MGALAARGVHGDEFAFKVSPGTTSAHAFDLALYDGQVIAGASLQPQAAKRPRRGIEFNARSLGDVVERIRCVQGKCVGEVFGDETQLGRGARVGNGPVELVGSRPLARTLQIRQVERLLAFVAQDIGIVLEHCGVLGERTRLVHAHHVHGAQ